MMTFNFQQVLTILVVHFIADFVAQTHKQATGKSENWEDLLSHTFTYSIAWFIPAMLLLDGRSYTHIELLWKGFVFSSITFFWHTNIDYITSRENAKLWKAEKVHAFFVGVGFDQMLHYIQLFLTLNYVLH